jgi:hypothetical protein
MPLYVAEFKFRDNNRENADIFGNGNCGMLTRQGAWWLTALALAALEPASWMTSHVPPCVVNPANYGDDYAQMNAPRSTYFFL